MGICTSDPLGYLIKQYGGDVCKYIVAQKSEQFLDQNTPKFTQRVQDQFKNTAANLDKQFDSKQNIMKQNFNSSLGDIKKQNPTALETAKTTQNKSQSEIFGFNSFTAQFQKLKAAKDDKLKEQESSIIRIIQQKKQDIRKSIKDNKPSLPLFDSMPICLKQKVLSDGQEKFAPQIKQGQQNIMGIFQKATNIGNLQNQIKKVAGLDSADKVVKDSQSAFDKAKKMLTFTSNPKSCFG